MRKFIPRFFNVISFVLAMFFLVPWLKISRVFDLISSKIPQPIVQKVCGNLSEFFKTYTSYRLIAIPAVLVGLAFIFLIVGLIDKAKSENGSTSRPITAMSYAPLCYMTIAGSVSGIMYHLFSARAFQFLATDFLGLGQLLIKVPFLAVGQPAIIGLAYYLVALVFALIASLIGKKASSKGFGSKIFTWIFGMIAAGLSFKGVWVTYEGNLGKRNLLGALTAKLSSNNPVEIEAFSHTETIVFIALAVFFVIAYIVFGIITAKVNAQVENDELYASLPIIEEAKPVVAEAPAPAPKAKATNGYNKTINLVINMPGQPAAAPLINQQDPLDNTPRSLSNLRHNLNDLFSNNFGFDECVMLRSGMYSSYYSNGTKFLTLTNNNRTMIFPSDSESAIKLMMKYPGVSKHSIMDDKTWYKIEDLSMVSREAAVTAIYNAYDLMK